jgi:hypothetical protein
MTVNTNDINMPEYSSIGHTSIYGNTPPLTQYLYTRQAVPGHHVVLVRHAMTCSVLSMRFHIYNQLVGVVGGKKSGMDPGYFRKV